MSKLVDEERAADAKRAETQRLIDFLGELLAVVKARAEELDTARIADRIGRTPRTVTRRDQLLAGLLETMKRKGIRRT